MAPDDGVGPDEVRTPDENVTILQAKLKVQIVMGWSEPEAHAWMRSIATHRQERLAVFAAAVLRCPPRRGPLLTLSRVRQNPPK
jgi:hypothetical protein